MPSNWLAYSAAISTDPLLDKSSLATGIFGAAVLIHSARLHGRKFDSVRICTDLSATICILNAIIVSTHTKSPTNDLQSVIMVDLLFYGFFSAVVQFCDSYMFYSRLLIMQRIPNWQRVAIITYIVVVLILTWLPTYTIVPFFYDTNSDQYLQMFATLNTVYSSGTVVYNAFFTFRCLLILSKMSHKIIRAARGEIQDLEQQGASNILSTHDAVTGPLEQTNIGGATGAGTGSGNKSGKRQRERAAVTPLANPLEELASGGGSNSFSNSLNGSRRNSKKMGANSHLKPVVNNDNNTSVRQPEAASSTTPRLLVSRRASTILAAEAVANGMEPGGEDYEPRVVQKIRVIAVKSLVHAFISTFAALFYAFGPPIGSYLWTLIVVLGMHVCFNMKGGDRFFMLCCPALTSSPLAVAPMTRHQREVAAIMKAQARNHVDNPRPNAEREAS